METCKKRKRGGKRCIAALCSNTYEDGVSLFHFPKDEKLAKQWSTQVKKTRADWKKPSKHSVLCSDHFEAGCFEQGPLLSAAFGLETKRRRVLKPDAVPTVFAKPHHAICQDAVTTQSRALSTGSSIPRPSTSTSATTTKPRSAYIKRNRKRVSILCPYQLS